jgi:hypothetical protein
MNPRETQVTLCEKGAPEVSESFSNYLKIFTPLTLLQGGGWGGVQLIPEMSSGIIPIVVQGAWLLLVALICSAVTIFLPPTLQAVLF